MATTIMVIVNGERQEAEASDVAGLVRWLGYGERRSGIAVAVNGEVVPRAGWTACGLSAGDRVEIVGAVQGG